MSKWNVETRKILYTQLTRKFGSHFVWTSTNMPSKNEKIRDSYKEFLDAFGKTIEPPTSGDAIAQQVAWAVTKQTEIRNQSLLVCMLQNKVIAYECGFIDLSYMPQKVSCDYTKGLPSGEATV